MPTLKSLFSAIRRFLRLERDIEQIVRPMSKIVRRLDRYEAAQTEMACQREAEAELLRAAAERKIGDAASLTVNAANARAQRVKFADFLG